MKRAVLWAVLLAVGAALPAATPAAGAGFAARANEICKQTAAKVYTMPPAQTEAQALKQVQTDAALFDRLTAQIGALRPPKPIAPGVGAMLAAFRATATALEQTSKAAIAGDGAAAGAALKRAEKNEVRAQKLAYAVGLSACAGDYRPGTKVYRVPSSSIEPTLHCARPGPGCKASATDRVRTPALRENEPKRLYFVMGDNRAQSCDSRQWGSVPRKNVVGKAIEILRGSKVIKLR